MHKKILALALPNILSNISIPLVSAVDTALMGHLSARHLSALGIGSMIFLFLYGTMNFLRMGSTGITAQAFGAEDREGIAKTLYRALLVALGLSLVLLLLQDTIVQIAFWLMNVEESYAVYTQQYFAIRIYTAPAVFMQYALMGWFFGMQNARYPLYMTLLVNLVNILCSYYFVMVLGMGIEGAAYGTLLSQYAGLFLAFVLLLYYKSTLKWFSVSALIQRSELLRFLDVNKDIFIRTLALTFSFAFFYSQASKHGEETLTVMILLLQFIIWFAYSMDGFANAGESLVGKYYGAKDWKNFDSVICYLFAWGLGLTLLYMLFYAYYYQEILQLYTNQHAIIEATLPFMPYVVVMPLLSFMAYIWDGIFIGMTASKAMRSITLWSTGLFIGLFYLTKGIDFTYALWIGFMLFFLFRGLLQSLYYFRAGKDLR